MEEKDFWVGVNMIPSMTPRRFYLLLEALSTAEKIWRASVADLKSVDSYNQWVERFCAQRNESELRRELEGIERRGLTILTCQSSEYPRALLTLDWPPPILYLKGRYSKENDSLAVAVVGTRGSSPYGEKVCYELSRALAQAGFTIVSGMARGIDTQAHRGALDGGGRTVAVLGTGLGHIYPRENVSLSRKISTQGAVISEFHLRQDPKRWTFPQRNRIISGLARGTVVVEAPKKSGALITARCALEQGREVFAVPGDARRDSFVGNHSLIKDGAKLVETAEDVIEEFPDLRPILPLGTGDKSGEDRISDLSKKQKKVFSALDYEPKHFNNILDQTGFSPAHLSHIIFELQMKDLVKRVAGSRWVKLV